MDFLFNNQMSWAKTFPLGQTNEFTTVGGKKSKDKHKRVMETSI